MHGGPEPVPTEGGSEKGQAWEPQGSEHHLPGVRPWELHLAPPRPYLRGFCQRSALIIAPPLPAAQVVQSWWLICIRATSLTLTTPLSMRRLQHAELVKMQILAQGNEGEA